jgi:ABC-type multidrug transport system ATPase subunit
MPALGWVMTSELVIETNGLVTRFGDRAAIEGVSLAVSGVCEFGPLGPKGAGKTTFIRMLLGLTPANTGEMRLLGLPDARGSAAPRRSAQRERVP